MKKIFTAAALLLALALCLTAAFAAGGDAGDPLISLSYLQNIFTSSADTQISQKLDQADTGVREEMDQQISGMKADILAASGLNTALSYQEAMLNEGDTLSGDTGLTVLALAGDIQLTILEGAVVDATAGSEVSSGTILTANHRYIVAESSLARFTATSPTAILSYQALTPSLHRRPIPITSPSHGLFVTWICSGAPAPVWARALTSIWLLPGLRAWSCLSVSWERRTMPSPASTLTPIRMYPAGWIAM